MADDATPANAAAAPAAAPRPQLSLFDSTCIIVGIIIGAGIYQMSPLIAAGAGGAAGTIAVWVAGGLFSLAGALCYAELAAAYPQQGGDYVYLTRAYGRGAGFFFAWSQMVIVQPGNIALLSFTFANYALTLYAPVRDPRPYAAAAIVVLTVLNVLGVRAGKWTQNVLTVVKALGLAALVVAGLMAPTPPPAAPVPAFTGGGLQLSLILVLFAYGGWNEMPYVAAEVRNPGRNIMRALVLGTGTVTVLYLLVNGAFLRALGYAGTAASQAVAVDTVAAVWPGAAERAIAVLVCISALGAVSVLVFTGARVAYALGAGHPAFHALGRWDPRRGAPLRALVLQGALSVAIVLGAEEFAQTLLYTTPVVWVFALGTGLSVFVLRRREPAAPRPYRIIGYPVTPVLFCLASAFMLYSGVAYAIAVKPYSLAVLAGVLLVGGAIFVWTEKKGRG